MKYIVFSFLFLTSVEGFAVSLDSYFRSTVKTKASSSVFTKTNFFVGHSLTQTSYTPSLKGNG